VHNDVWPTLLDPPEAVLAIARDDDVESVLGE
jgi:hypothetical protein